MDEPLVKRQKIENQLNILSKFTTVVADTGEIDAIKFFSPQDATTNPSLIFKAAELPQYKYLVDDAIGYAVKISADNTFDEILEIVMDKLAVNFGAEITKIVPGYVSTEVDARLSFNVEATVARARRIISLYNEIGINKSRVLIKIASTYEGIRAAEILQKEGITCNLTLLFSLTQAAACAEAGVTLISPFVGRILDWYKAKTGKVYSADEDPGVQSVAAIYGYYKKFGYSTIVMGASFRSKEEVLALAGCDRLTIAPSILKELQSSQDTVNCVLKAENAAQLYPGDKVAVDEVSFRLAMNEDAMSTEKLAEGIRNFSVDIIKLENIVSNKLRDILTTTYHQLDQLGTFTIVVADTGDINTIKEFKPTDATTNPSLLYKAAGMSEYAYLVDEAIQYGRSANLGNSEDTLALILDKLAVNFGAEITKIVSGYVSTEVDARLSFDTSTTIQRARRLIKLYEEMGINKSRILIKIASTYEGIRAAEILQKEGITCNLTLLFSLTQAAACAEAGVTLISPFVGRILDWYKAKTGKVYSADEDPGVQSVAAIYGYYKKFGYSTIVMGASFRSKEEVLALAGCDRLTIAPSILKELQSSHHAVQQVLFPSKALQLYPGEKVAVDEASFRLAMNEDAMATEKLAEGIRNFSADIKNLENIIRDKLLL